MAGSTAIEQVYEPSQVELRQEFVREKLTQRWTQTQIVEAVRKSGKMVTVGKATISNDCAAIRARWNEVLRAEAIEHRSGTLANLMELSATAWRQYKRHKTPEWWKNLLQAEKEIAILLGLNLEQEGKPGPKPGETPDRPLYVAQVGYNINAMLDDPEVSDLVRRLDARLKELSGNGEGLILEGDYEVRG